MQAIPADQRVAHHALTRRLTAAATIRDLPDGMAFSFASEFYDDIVLFIAHERLCCPFLRFALDISPARGPITLTLTGPPGAAAFIRSELGVPGI